MLVDPRLPPSLLGTVVYISRNAWGCAPRFVRLDEIDDRGIVREIPSPKYIFRLGSESCRFVHVFISSTLLTMIFNSI
jgi:hypothetical protein